MCLRRRHGKLSDLLIIARVLVKNADLLLPLMVESHRSLPKEILLRILQTPRRALGSRVRRGEGPFRPPNVRHVAFE